MVQSRSWGRALLAFALGISVIQTGWSESPKSRKKQLGTVQRAQFTSQLVAPAANPLLGRDLTCAVYSLGELEDPDLAKWVADTLPTVIQPGSWNRGDTRETLTPTLNYYAPAKILVVHHTPAVQSQVDAFLKNLKKALPRGQASLVPGPQSNIKSTLATGLVVPAKFSPSNTTPAASATAKPYLIAEPQDNLRPKHLFHFIIRYEGDGIIDANVARMMKAVYGQTVEAAKAAESESPASPVAPATPANSPTAPGPAPSATPDSSSSPPASNAPPAPPPMPPAEAKPTPSVPLAY